MSVENRTIPCVLMVAGEPHRQAVFELWAGQPQRAACSRLLGQLNPLICQWVISGTQTSKATDSRGQTDKHTVHTYTRGHTWTHTRPNTYTSQILTYQMTCCCAQKSLIGAIYSLFEVFRELSWCQSFECSCGLNVLLTLGNRSWPLFPSYRHRQRLCVCMCGRPGHVGTCLL